MTHSYKNASTFSPFDSSVGSQKSIDELEKQKKKDKQEFYRNQLDQFVQEQPKSQSSSRNPGQSQKDQDYGYGQSNDQRRQPQQRVNQGKSYTSNNNENDLGGYYGQQGANDESDKKRRLQQEMVSENQRQIQEKEAQKKREKAREQESDKQRVQEQLYQHEYDSHQQKEKNRRLIEENNKQVQQQRKDYSARGNVKEQDVNPYDYNPSHQSKPLSSKTNQQQYDHGYDQVASSMENLNIKSKNQKHDNDMRNILQQGYVSTEQKAREDYQPQRRHNEQNQPSSGNDYQKNRDRVRFGNSYNIITNDS